VGTCAACGSRSPLISEALGSCVVCLRAGDSRALDAAASRHIYYRRAFALPESTPRSQGGLLCDVCSRECVLGEGEKGFCNVRSHAEGRIGGGERDGAFLRRFQDALPCDCVSAQLCRRKGEKDGTQIGVFYESCSFDCLYCQNWRFKRSEQTHPVSADMLSEDLDASTRCVRFFGGDPGPQVHHALAAARQMLERASGQDLAICWETNASVSPPLLDEMAELSRQTGGVVRIDLKAFDDRIHKALCGISNQSTLRNFQRLVSSAQRRDESNGFQIVASTPLLPGYIDPYEVDQIARFIAGVDPDLPYILLASRPDFSMSDLPSTSEQHAWQAEQAARAAGLKHVYLGNRHLLGPNYPE